VVHVQIIANDAMQQTGSFNMPGKHK